MAAGYRCCSSSSCPSLNESQPLTLCRSDCVWLRNNTNAHSAILFDTTRRQQLHTQFRVQRDLQTERRKSGDFALAKSGEKTRFPTGQQREFREIMGNGRVVVVMTHRHEFAMNSTIISRIPSRGSIPNNTTQSEEAAMDGLFMMLPEILLLPLGKLNPLFYDDERTIGRDSALTGGL